MHSSSALPSAWLTRWAHLIPPGGRVLDLACGHGRHAHWLARQGFQVTAVDRDPAALQFTQQHWPCDAMPGRVIQADLESGPWPPQPFSAADTWDAIVITHYLWRPLWPALLHSLAPDGVYLHETFAHGNATVGKPSRPEFLLQPGELLRTCADLRIVAFEDGFVSAPDRFVQRIVAVRERVAAHTLTDPPRHHLQAPR
jgi:SAM-dependent methyltransferase